MATNFQQKNSTFFSCNLCDFVTCKKKNYENHLQTKKHISNNLATFSNTMATKKILTCSVCNKIYNDRSGLWRHKKKCCKENELNPNATNTPINDNDKEQLIIMLIKQNSELIKETAEFKNFMMDQQNVMLEVIKNGTHHTTTNTNSNNQSFNLQFFLNETCKNAMNMSTFIDSLQLQLSDLENIGEVGFVEGISSIIVKNLNALDITLRPVHCTDKKRETMYIKDQDIWEKEDENKSKMHKMVKKVANKNIKLISKFQEVHPEWKKITSKVSDQFNKIVIEAMGGKGENDFEKEEKIIKRVAKEVLVTKL
jgi:hypothetical protein